MRKRIIYVIIIVVLLLTGCTIGGSFYMLNFSLTPDAKICLLYTSPSPRD